MMMMIFPRVRMMLKSSITNKSEARKYSPTPTTVYTTYPGRVRGHCTCERMMYSVKIICQKSRRVYKNDVHGQWRM